MTVVGPVDPGGRDAVGDAQTVQADLESGLLKVSVDVLLPLHYQVLWENDIIKKNYIVYPLSGYVGNSEKTIIFIYYC